MSIRGNAYNKPTTRYDFIQDTYTTVFEPIVNDREGIPDLLIIKKLLVGFSEYIGAVYENKRSTVSTDDVIQAIIVDYKI